MKNKVLSLQTLNPTISESANVVRTNSCSLVPCGAQSNVG